MQHVAALVRRIPVPVEFAIVMLGAFGWFSYVSVTSFDVPITEPLFVEDDLAWLIRYESLALAVLLPFLALRGWTAQRVGLTASRRLALDGLVLTVAAYGAVFATWFVASAFGMPEVQSDVPFVGEGTRPLTKIALSLLNPFFEELFVCGYLMTVVGPRRRSLAIALSAGVRLLYHLYQGPAAIVTVAPLGLVYAWWYARKRQLFPLMVSHAVLDLWAVFA